ncbi:MAG: transglutaminase domain-containing protein [Bacteroidaceae bacterium]|nr:transglutaminase domain-containing protein [Bacteroidaceae bacterium]
MLEQALQFAGENRVELEKVLTHYVDDSLKLEAAKFLIRNMPGHFSYAYSDTTTIMRYASSIDSIVESMKDEIDFNIVRDSIDSMANKLGIDTLHKVQDCQIVTSEFLIQNIDAAFYDWQHGTWAQHLDFDDFCEWILPYKMEEQQPLDDWRSRLKGFCAKRLNDLDYCDQLRESPLAAAKLLNGNLADSLHPVTGLSVQYANIPLEHRVHIPFGGCGDYASMATTIFRSHGIPVVKEFTPQWAKRSLGHAWNVLLSDDGRQVPFGGICTRLGELHKYEEKLAKVYRNTYARNDELLELNNSGEFVPQIFRNIFIRDVTSETILCSDVKLNTSVIGCKYAYLMVFDNKDWCPVAYGRIVNGNVFFQNVGRNVLYLPAIYEKGIMKPIGNPFILDKKGCVTSITPNTQRCLEMVLDRKYPVMEYAYEYIPRLKDGEFQASNDANFKTYYVVHRIKEGHASGQRVIIPDSIPACRYWRYINNRYSTFCSIAEIMFYAKGDTTKLHGTVIGTTGSWGGDPKRTRDVVFDGDILTAFDAPKGEGCWAGLDFGHPVKLSHLIYYGRGDGNSVEIGDEYELLYWNKDKWESLGKQEARDLHVRYERVPSKALYLLQNHTKGIDERVFTYEKGKQVWW